MSHGSSGYQGTSGSRGHDGSRGSSGSSSHPGHNGTQSPHGAISFAVLGEGGEVRETAGTCYSLAVAGYVLEDARLDCVFEPGEGFRVQAVGIVNQGGLTCPAGAVLSFVSTNTAFFSAANSLLLPEIAPGDTFVVRDFVFEGTFYDVPPPVSPGPFCGHASFQSRVEMLGRPFWDGFVATEVELGYSVRFGQVQVARQLGTGERSRVSLPLRNLSTLPLGGSVAVRVELAPCIVACGLPGTTLLFSVDSLDGGSAHEVSFEVLLRDDAQLFEQYSWKVRSLFIPSLVSIQPLLAGGADAARQGH